VETQRIAIAPGCTGVIGRRGRWWIGWIEEIGGANSQAETRDELIENLGSALEEALEMR
jgi:predicted RNase H-like HicB family nuclease